MSPVQNTIAKSVMEAIYRISDKKENDKQYEKYKYQNHPLKTACLSSQVKQAHEH